MSTPGSVTVWISELKAGNHDAAQALWDRYFRRLVGLARTKLAKKHRRAAGPEDVALSAFDSFCRGAEQGRFPQLRDRDNLWPLLVVITARKAIDLIDRNQAQKRGGGRVQGESALMGLLNSSGVGAGIERVLSREPTPEFAVEVAEECERLLALLGEEKLRRVALLKLEGYTDKEVATQLGVSLHTVERKLRRIRCIWQEEIQR